MTDTPVAVGVGLLPLEPPSSPAITARATEQKPSKLPPVTTGTSEAYIQGLARAVSRASATDPLTVMFETEKLPLGQSAAELDLPALQRIVYKAASTRAKAKVAGGSFVVEAGGFAAVACWEPGRADQPYHLDAQTAAQKPAFSEFTDKVAEKMRAFLYPVAERVSGGKYWKLSLMARDPGVEYVPGAVRAVLVPFIERFASHQNEGGPMPVWLVAGNAQARAVYAHFGFRDVGEIDVNGIKTWGMVYTGNIDVNMVDHKNSA
ncbi:hypothetical protein F4804DRAFT_31422 [Jackrogersella minutella]|nr:hypothetical protein F4804DRAFT_31422 [Jackrogersella minutella]